MLVPTIERRLVAFVGMVRVTMVHILAKTAQGLPESLR